MTRENASNAGSHLAKSAGAGLLAGFLLVLFLKETAQNVPLERIEFGLLMVMGLGLAFGVWAAGIMKRPRAWSGWMAGAIVLVLAAVAVNQNVTSHYLTGQFFYPYALVYNKKLHIAALAAKLLFGPLLLAPAGVAFGASLRDGADARRGFGAFALGLGVGGAAAALCTAQFGVYVPLALGGAASVLLLADRRWAVGAALCCIALAVFAASNQRFVFYTQRAQDFDLLETRRTAGDRVDFISFNEDRCLGSLYNMAMIYYTCDDVAMEPATVRRLLKSASAGKKRILTAGRPDGQYQQILLDADPGIEKLVTVDYDPVALKELSGPLAKYNGGAFQNPASETIAGDIRLTMEREAAAGKTFDLIALHKNGLNVHPLGAGVINREDYLTTRQAYKTIFNRLLTEKGVFLADIPAGDKEDERTDPNAGVYKLLANLPEGVSARAFKFLIWEAPVSGEFRLLAVASKDRGEVDRIANDILIASAFEEIKLGADKLRNAAHSDAMPIRGKDSTVVWFALGIVALFAIGVVTLHIGMRSPWEIPVSWPYLIFYAFGVAMMTMLYYEGRVINQFEYSKPRPILYLLFFLAAALLFVAQYTVRALGKWRRATRNGIGTASTFVWMSGAGMGALFALLWSRGAWLLTGFAGLGSMWAPALCLAGFSASCRLMAGKQGGSKATLLAGVVVLVGGALFGSAGLAGPAVCVAALAVLSIAGAAPLALSLDGTPASEAPRGGSLALLGALFGFWFGQWLLAMVGPIGAGVLIGLWFLRIHSFRKKRLIGMEAIA